MPQSLASARSAAWSFSASRRLNNLSIIVMDEKNMVMAIVDDEITLPSMEGWKLSLLSFSDECLGVTASGVAYPLENARLTSDYPLGTSNEIIKEEAFIK